MFPKRQRGCTDRKYVLSLQGRNSLYPGSAPERRVSAKKYQFLTTNNEMMKKNFFLRAAALLWAIALCGGLPVACSDSNTDEPPVDPTPPPGPEATELQYNTFCGYYFDSELGIGNYVVTLASEWPDDLDNPANEGDFMVILDLYSDLSDISEIRLPVGTYEMGQKWTKNVWSPEATAFQIRLDGEVETSPLMAGKVTVTAEGDEYEIAVDLLTTSGVPVKAVYKGELERFYSYGAVNFASFTEDQNVAFEKYNDNACLYYGNWTIPHADDFSLVFYTGEMSGPAQQVSGYMLHLEGFMHKQADYNLDPMPIEEGVYNVASAPVNHATLAIPMTINPGMTIEQWGSNYVTFSYLSYVDGRTGARTIGLIADGKVTVTKTAGDSYRFDFDFQTDKGVAITGSYEGEVKMQNRNDTDNPNTLTPMPQRPWSTVPGDVDLNFSDYTEAACYYMGSYLYPGYDSWRIDIFGTDGPGADAEPAGDYLTFEVLVPAGTFGPLPEGTYTIGWGPGDRVAFPGFISHTAGIFYAWYGDMSSRDSEGVAAIKGPINEGTFIVTKTGDAPAAGYDAVYKFVFDLRDDASHAIKGEWTGPIVFEDFTSEMGSSVRAFGLRR